MTTEQILQGVYAILHTLPDDDRIFAEKQISAHVKSKNDNGLAALAISNLVISLKDDLAKEEAKKGGKGAALKAVNSMLKEARNSPRSLTIYNAPIIDGKQCVCDGYRAVRLVNHLPLNVPSEPAGYINLDNLIHPSLFCDGYELELPDPAKLRAYIKDCKAKSAKSAPFLPVYCFGENRPAVDARFLADMMDILPNAKAYGNGVTSNVVFRCEDGSDGILLRVRSIQNTKTQL